MCWRANSWHRLRFNVTLSTKYTVLMRDRLQKLTQLPRLESPNGLGKIVWGFYWLNAWIVFFPTLNTELGIIRTVTLHPQRRSTVTVSCWWPESWRRCGVGAGVTRACSCRGSSAGASWEGWGSPARGVAVRAVEPHQSLQNKSRAASSCVSSGRSSGRSPCRRSCRWTASSRCVCACGTSGCRLGGKPANRYAITIKRGNYTWQDNYSLIEPCLNILEVSPYSRYRCVRDVRPRVWYSRQRHGPRLPAQGSAKFVKKYPRAFNYMFKCHNIIILILGHTSQKQNRLTSHIIALQTTSTRRWLSALSKANE